MPELRGAGDRRGAGEARGGFDGGLVAGGGGLRGGRLLHALVEVVVRARGESAKRRAVLPGAARAHVFIARGALQYNRSFTHGLLDRFRHAGGIRCLCDGGCGIQCSGQGRIRHVEANRLADIRFHEGVCRVLVARGNLRLGCAVHAGPLQRDPAQIRLVDAGEIRGERAAIVGVAGDHRRSGERGDLRAGDVELQVTREGAAGGKAARDAAKLGEGIDGVICLRGDGVRNRSPAGDRLPADGGRAARGDALARCSEREDKRKLAGVRGCCKRAVDRRADVWRCGNVRKRARFGADGIVRAGCERKRHSAVGEVGQVIDRVPVVAQRVANHRAGGRVRGIGVSSVGDGDVFSGNQRDLLVCSKDDLLVCGCRRTHRRRIQRDRRRGGVRVRERCRRQGDCKRKYGEQCHPFILLTIHMCSFPRRGGCFLAVRSGSCFAEVLICVP